MSDYADVVAETTATDGTPFRVVLHYDEGTDSPREWSNAGVMHVIDQSRYIVPREGNVPSLDAAIIDHDFRVVARWLRMFHDATVVLPLYSTGGRDLVIAAGDATDAPGAGNYIGVMFDTPDTRRETFGPFPHSVDLTTAAMRAEAATYAQWCEGEVYGLAVQSDELDDDDIAEWVDSDHDQASLWGLIGRDWAEENAREALDAVVADHDETVAQRRADEADDAAEIDELRAIEVGAYAV